jgi:hypothetical protein
MLRRLVHFPRTRLFMTSRSQLPGAIAAARLAQTAGHLTGPNSSSAAAGRSSRMASTTAGSSSTGAPNVEFKEIKHITCVGAGLMGEWSSILAVCSLIALQGRESLKLQHKLASRQGVYPNLRQSILTRG